MVQLVIIVLTCLYIAPVSCDSWVNYLGELIDEVKSPPDPSWTVEYLKKQRSKHEYLNIYIDVIFRSLNRLSSAVKGGQKRGTGSGSYATQDQINNINRRIDDLNDFQTSQERISEATSALIKTIQATIDDIYEKIEGQGSQSSGSGDTYTRWGRTTCPSDATLVYDGYSAGSPKYQKGSGANILCLPKDPEYSGGNNRRDTWVGRIYGIEYQIKNSDVYSNSFHDAEMSCAVCLTKRSTALMIPAKRTCQNGWNKEYSGYLMSAANAGDRQPSEFICVDENIEAVSNARADNDQGNVYLVESACGSLPCPNYKEGAELTCVVCSK